MNYWWAGSTKQ